jgi:hypothetical protein
MNTTPRPELEAMPDEVLAHKTASLICTQSYGYDAAILEEAARRLRERRWRPCEGDGSDIPRDVNSCLVATDSGSVGEAARVTDDDQDEWWWAGTQGEYYSDPIRFTANLKAWQPLPPPPAGKREEEPK